MVGRRLTFPRKALLKTTEIARWHANMSRGSLITADTYLRRLGAFCDATHVTPQGLPKRPEKELHGLLLDFVSQEERKGRAGSYINSSVKAVKSWLLHNGVKITLPVKVRNPDRTPTLEGERTPSQDELRRLLLTAGPRDRVSAVLMAHGGVRPEVLGNYEGNDGLRLKDLPELKIQDKKVEFESMPTMVIVRGELSKAGHRYITFLGEEGCSYLRDYLERRLLEGEKLEPDTDVIHPKGSGKAAARWTGNEGVKPFMRTTKVGDQLRHMIRGAGFDWRPYILRAYFDTQLLLAESKGKVAHDYRVFWMGHKGSMEARYTTNKGRLPKDLIDDMREAYKRAEPFLSTIPTKGAQDTQSNIARVMLQGLGYTDEDLEDKDLLDPQVFQQLVKEKMTSAAPRQKQKLVEAVELPRYLEDGWTVVATFGDHQAVLNPPGG